MLSISIEYWSWFLSESTMRTLLRLFPSVSVRKVMQIYDTMERRSAEIIAEKKAALSKGDAALAHEVGEGKDIMSILRERSHLFSV